MGGKNYFFALNIDISAIEDAGKREKIVEGMAARR